MHAIERRKMSFSSHMKSLTHMTEKCSKKVHNIFNHQYRLHKRTYNHERTQEKSLKTKITNEN